MRLARRCVLALAGTMLASEANASAGERVAKVVVVGDDTEAALVHAGVSEELERLGVRVETGREGSVLPEEVVRPRPNEGPVVARVWIDSRSDKETILYVTDQTASRILVRHFPREGRIEIAREAMMVVVQTSVDALLHGAAIGVTRDEARAELGLSAPAPLQCPPATPTAPPAAPSAPEPVPAPTTTLGLGIAYEIGGYAANAVEHGPVATLELARRLGNRPFGLALSGQYRFPMSAAHDPLVVRLESGAVRLTAFGTPLRTRHFDLRLFAGGGVDVVRADPDIVRAVDATLKPVSRIDAVFRIGSGIRAPLRVFPGVMVELDIALDVAPFVRSYAVARGGQQTELLVPWIVRPLVLLGLTM